MESTSDAVNDPASVAEDPASVAAGFDPEHLPAEFFENPYPTYRWLRERDPVHRCPDGSFFLTRYADLDTVYRDRTHFSSDKKRAFGPKFGLGTPLYEHHTTSLVFNDDPYHARVRRQIAGALTPNALKAMTPAVTALIERLGDALAEKGRFDLIEDFSAAIPVEVIGNLLGVPREQRASLRAWSLAILGALDPALTMEQLARGQQAVKEFLAFTKALVDERRGDLRGPDDLLSRLIQDESGGAPLSETELLHNCIFLLNAGHETTTNLIGNALVLLLTHDGERARLMSNPALDVSTVEECLRYESSNQFGNRLVSAAVTLGGVELAPGDYLTLCIGAANRDRERFPDPDRFDIGRTPNPHLGFAAGGHACVGMSVARLEGQLAVGPLLRRFPTLTLAGTPIRGRRARFRGFRSIPAALA
jgi:cytochrome P450